MYLGEPPERHEVPVGGLVHVEAGTVLQIVNETDEEVVVVVWGAPPERAGADMFESAV
jgi:quercetin dioxygenase-like cupin family protein